MGAGEHPPPLGAVLVARRGADVCESVALRRAGELDDDGKPRPQDVLELVRGRVLCVWRVRA